MITTSKNENGKVNVKMEFELNNYDEITKQQLEKFMKEVKEKIDKPHLINGWKKI